MDCKLHEGVVCSLELADNQRPFRKTKTGRAWWPGAISSSLRYRRACIVNSTKSRTRYTRPRRASGANWTVSASRCWQAHCAPCSPSTALIRVGTARSATAGAGPSPASAAHCPAGPISPHKWPSCRTSRRHREVPVCPRATGSGNVRRSSSPDRPSSDCPERPAATRVRRNPTLGPARHSTRMSPSCTTVAMRVPSRANS